VSARLGLVLDDDVLDELADLVAARLAGRGQASGWLDVDGAAAHMSCSRKRIYNLVRAGRLPAHRDGRLLRFRVAEIDAYIEANGG